MRRVSPFQLALSLIACAAFLWSAGFLAGGSRHGQLWAQNDEAAEEAAGDEVVADEAEAPADDAGADGAAEGGNTEGGSSQKPKTYLEWVIGDVGISYLVVFLGISFTLVALVVMNFLGARRDTICPEELVEGFEAHLNAGQFQEAYDLARTDESFLGQVLKIGLEKWDQTKSFPQSIEAMQEVGEEETMKLEHRLSYIALIGTISPMVGLLGTVQGMISSFRVIAISGATPEATKLADGISQALFTTLVGLLIAIPAIAVYNILKNRVQRLVLEVGITSESLMARFEHKG